MSAVDNERAHQSGLCVENGSINFLNSFAAGIIIAITGVPGEMHVT